MGPVEVINRQPRCSVSPCPTFLCSKHKISSQPIDVLPKGMDFCNIYATSILPGKSWKLPLLMESFQRKKQRGNHPPLLLLLAHAQQKPNHHYLLKASSDAKPTGFWDGWKYGFLAQEGQLASKGSLFHWHITNSTCTRGLYSS